MEKNHRTTPARQSIIALRKASLKALTIGFCTARSEAAKALVKSIMIHDHGAPVSMIRIQYSLIYHPQSHIP
jgi:hypothetical protein